MFKKLVSLAIVLMLVMSMAAIAASAAQVEIAENAADTPAAVGAEGGADTGAEGGADTGAEGGADTGADNKIYFDSSSTGWNNFDTIAFHIWGVDDEAFEGKDWGAKAENGTDEGNGVWSYDISSKLGQTIQSGKQYAVIFYSKVGGSAAMQTYNLLFGSPCLGQTASCNGTVYENPEDSNKTTQAAVWGGGIDAATYGPELKITSIGNVVGTCCAASTSPYKMFVDFLQNTLTNARTFSGKDDQTLIDDTAKALGLKQDDVEAAIKESGVSGIEWDKSKSSLDTGSDEKAHQKGDGSEDDSKTETPSGDTKSTTSTGNTTGGSGSSGGSSSGSSSGSSGSGSGATTGQETTVLYIMLGVMVAAAAAVFFLRKKDRA